MIVLCFLGRQGPWFTPRPAASVSFFPFLWLHPGPQPPALVSGQCRLPRQTAPFLRCTFPLASLFTHLLQLLLTTTSKINRSPTPRFPPAIAHFSVFPSAKPLEGPVRGHGLQLLLSPITLYSRGTFPQRPPETFRLQIQQSGPSPRLISLLSRIGHHQPLPAS